MSAWKGALDLAGARIHVKLRPLVKATRDPSFKNLAPNGQPPVSQPRLDTEGKEVTKIVKGVEVSKGEFVMLTDAQVEQIKGGGKTVVAEPDKFCPLESIDLAVNTMSFSVIPDSDVAGADGPVQQLWNGLLAGKLAFVTRLVSGGGKDRIVAIYATETELRAVAIPFTNQSYSKPEYEFVKDAKLGKAVAAGIAKKYEVSDLEVGSYKMEWLERREEQIAAAIEGKPPPAPAEEPPAAPDTDSLVAALETAVEEATEKPKKKTAKKKAAASK